MRVRVIRVVQNNSNVLWKISPIFTSQMVSEKISKFQGMDLILNF